MNDNLLYNFNNNIMQNVVKSYNTISATIVIIDSGVGGLYTYNVVKKLLPNASYIYIFDNKEFPYGNKTESFLLKRVISIIQAINNIYNKIDLVIIACSTVSTMISFSTLQSSFKFPIIGLLPNILSAIKITRNKIIALLATEGTIKRYYIHNYIKNFCKNYKIILIGTNMLATLIEEKLRGKQISIKLIYEVLHPIFKLNYPDTLILGCTHFSFIKKELRILFPNVYLIDSNIKIAYDAYLILRNKYYFTCLYNKKNISYCLSNIYSAKELVPILNKYGFISLDKLII